MPISLDPKTDTLPIPAKDYKAFCAELVKTYNKDKLKGLKIEENNQQAVVANLETLNGHAQNLKDNGYPVLFHYDWNKTFAKNIKDGKKIFAELQKTELKQLEGKARTALQGKKRLAANLAVAAKAANDEADKVLQTFKVLNDAVAAAEQPTTPATAAPAASGNSPAQQPAQTAPATTQTQKAESINRELFLSKKLLEIGFITENEHLLNLLKIKNILKEVDGTTTPPVQPNPTPAGGTPATGQQAAPAAQPAGATVDPKVARTEFGSLISSVASPKEETFFKNYMDNVNYLQDIGTKQSQANLNENTRKLIKAFVKKSILKEAAIGLNEENKKEYLNEFILGLAVAALAALAAWAGKKLADMFKSGPAVLVPPDPRYRAGSNDPDEDEAGEISQEFYIDPSTGRVVDAKGKVVDPNAQANMAARYKAYFESVKTKYASVVAELNKKLPACGYPPDQNTKIQTNITAIPTAIVSSDNLSKALDEYLKS